MESKQSHSIPDKKRHATMIGTLGFLLFDLIWISLLAWILLEILFIYKAIHNHNTNLVKIFIDVSQLSLARIRIFIKFIPFLLVILSIFIIDGLVLRDKRKFQGARESTFIFHRIKPLAKFSFILLYFIYMVLPYPVMPSLFLLPMALLTGLFATLTIRSFKKYL